MEASILTNVILPLSLFIIMLGMGMTLVVDDFKRIFIYPKAVSLGLIGQLLLLPCVGFLIASLIPMPAELSVGIMILAACPGGTTSNIIAHLAKGDTALSITLTAISSIITIISIPLIINFALTHFMGTSSGFVLPIKTTMLTLFVITLLPVSIGMFIKAKANDFALKQEKRLNLFAGAFFVLLVILIIISERENILIALITVGPACILLNVGMMSIGYLLAKLLSLNSEQSKTITIEIGVQNTTLAFVIIGTLLANATFALPAAIYSLIMYVSCGLFITWKKRQIKQ